MGDIYCHPEKYALEAVGEVSWTDEPWEFDLTAVWTDDAGVLYWADDSGCSCPTPFEHIGSVRELETGPFGALSEHLRARQERVGTDAVQSQVAELLGRIRA